MRFRLFWLLALLNTTTCLAADSRPNIVVILADDLGWADLGCYGADLHQTPHIDQLASQGMRFMDAYAMPVCSPTRAALLTGGHAARVPMTIWSEGSVNGPADRPLLQADSLHSLPHGQPTLATYLQQSGYLTALVGKWHLGDANHYPETHGFDVNIGGTHWGAPQSFWWPYRGRGRFGNEYRYVPHLEFGQPDEYLTDRLTDEALRVIDQAGEQPFFLYLAHHAPHTPIEAKATDVQFFQSQLKPHYQHQNPVYAAMLKSLDESVGRVLSSLRERGLEQNTIVIFMSDNGGFVGIDNKSGQTVAVTSNAPLRSGKGSCYEGGIRVPLIIRWPGVTAAGRTNHQPVIVMDLFPTLLAAAGLTPSPQIPCDGLDLRPLLEASSTELSRSALYFHYPHYYPTTTPVSAIRAGDWKLLEYLEDGRLELYNLANDLSESKNLSEQQPEKTAALRQQLNDWRQQVQAAMPRPNPNYIP